MTICFALDMTAGDWRRRATVFGIPCFAAACTLAFPVGEYRGQPLPEATDGNAVDASDSDGGECNARRIPERPQGPLAQGGGSIELAVAFDALEATDSLATSTSTSLGARFDLDGVCTCPGPSSCNPPPNERTPCDAPGGVDNAGGRVFGGIVDLGTPGRTTSQRLRAGSETIALRVRNFNGTTNDDAVEAMLFSVLPEAAPRWDGSDVRIPEANGLFASDPLIARIVDPAAFVRDGWLVVAFAGTLRIGGIPVPFVDGHLVAKLETSGDLTTINEGHVMGRLVLSELLGALGRLEDPGQNDAGLCASPAYPQLKEAVCRARDIHVDPKSDGLPTSCDGLSLSVRFTAPPIKLGAPANAPVAAQHCTTFVDDCP